MDKVKHSYSVSIHPLLLLFVMTGAGSCGVEVGNPTKPVATPTADEQKTLALVSTEQLEETLFASSETQNIDQTLRLLARSCSTQSDGSVLVESDLTETSNRNLPLARPNRNIAVETSRTITTKSTSESSGLGCGPQERFATFNWNVLTGYQAEKTSTRSTQKTIKDIATGTTRETVAVSAEGNRSVGWTRLSYDGSVLAVNKSVRFESTLQRNTTRDGTLSEYKSKVATLANLSINQNSQNGKVKHFTIESGKVVSNFQNSQKLVLEYKNLTFVNSISCYPQSGKISATIYQDESLTLPVYTYDINFDSGDASMIFTDGTAVELDLVDCSLSGD